MEKQNKVSTIEELVFMAEKMDKRLEKLEKIIYDGDKKNIKTIKKRAAADKATEELEREIFGYCNDEERYYYYPQQFFQDAFSKKLEFAGMKFDDMLIDLRIHRKSTNESGCFDIVLRNANSLAIINVERHISSDFVQEMAMTKSGLFRRLFPEYNDCTIYLGVAGLSFSEQVVNDAKEYGVAIIRQDGQRVVLDSLPTKTY
jgi:hypothetical protein